MSITPLGRTSTASSSTGLRVTPATSQPHNARVRSPRKGKTAYEPRLYLRSIIGTTVSSPSAFDALPDASIFAYTAGAAAVVVTVEADNEYKQRFFRASPSVTSLSYDGLQLPSTPGYLGTQTNGKNRAITALRESGIGYSPSTPRSSGFNDWTSAESPTSRASERVKAATCLSISRDGNFIAIGETGYLPRVLIFALRQPSSNLPVTILTEHTFGVRALAFSPDGKYLATLGNVNDGFLHIWTVDRRGAARLYASNKCTSFIKDVAWVGSSLVTVGTRHVKVWKPEDVVVASPSKRRIGQDSPVDISTSQPLFSSLYSPIKTLAGRNTILGPLADTTFTCIKAISDQLAVVCTDSGDVCLLDESGENSKLIRVTGTGIAINCVAMDEQTHTLRFGGADGSSSVITLDDLTTRAMETRSDDYSSVSKDKTFSGNVALVAMAYLPGMLMTVDSGRTILAYEMATSGLLKPSVPLKAHRDPVQGVGAFQTRPGGQHVALSFYTWSPSGSIICWDVHGKAKHSLQIPMEHALDGEMNVCLRVLASEKAEFFAATDKLGMLSILVAYTGDRVFHAKAHSSDVLDIAMLEDPASCLVATAGRDRTLQLHERRHQQWSLIQTLDEHSASVSAVMFSSNGQELISASTDRTVHVRQIVRHEDHVAAVPMRIITLKSAPISMCLSAARREMNNIVVSLMDRSILTIGIRCGKIVSSFRAADVDGNEAVVLDSLISGCTALHGSSIIAGISSTDKSIRVYDADTGALLDREWGHTAAITAITLLRLDNDDKIGFVSTGMDGTIMIWDMLSKSSLDLSTTYEGTSEETPSKMTKSDVASRAPLRRILSKAELATFTALQPSQPSTPNNSRASPPRVRRRTSRGFLVNNANPPGSSSHSNAPLLPQIPASYSSEGPHPSKREKRPLSTRARSRSPLSNRSPQRVIRRPSLGALTTRTSKSSIVDLRSKDLSSALALSAASSSLTTSTDQICRTLRTYRKKLQSSSQHAECSIDGTTSDIAVCKDSLRDLDRELRATQKVVVERLASAMGKRRRESSEGVLREMMERYSERLVGIFDEKLRISLRDSVGHASGGESLAGGRDESLDEGAVEATVESRDAGDKAEGGFLIGAEAQADIAEV